MVKQLLLITVLVGGGFLLILAEVCTPSFGVLAVASIASFIAGVYLAFKLNPILGGVLLAGLLAGVPVYLSWLVRRFPDTRMGRRLTLGKVDNPTAGAVPESEQFANLLGKEGLTSSVLRPSGTVEIEGNRIVATAESGLIPAGTRVKVIKHDGMNIVVQPME